MVMLPPKLRCHAQGGGHRNEKKKVHAHVESSVKQGWSITLRGDVRPLNGGCLPYRTSHPPFLYLRRLELDRNGGEACEADSTPSPTPSPLPRL